MEVGFARRARALLEAGGLPVDYHESDAAHHIDPAHVPAAVAWLGRTLAPASAVTGAERVPSGLAAPLRHAIERGAWSARARAPDGRRGAAHEQRGRAPADRRRRRGRRASRPARGRATIRAWVARGVADAARAHVRVGRRRRDRPAPVVRAHGADGRDRRALERRGAADRRAGRARRGAAAPGAPRPARDHARRPAHARRQLGRGAAAGHARRRHRVRPEAHRRRAPTGSRAPPATTGARHG